MESHDPFDPDYMRGILDHGFYPILDHYFRTRLLGAQRLPRGGPFILAGNHSGTAFPYDGMALDMLLWRRDGFDPAAKYRTVYEKMLSLHWWMRPFGLDNFWRRGGGVDLTFDNFDQLLARGDRVIYYPEGVAGIGKGFQRRYQLQPFHTSFVVLAARHGVPVYPVNIVNAEWVIPFNFTLRPVDWVMRKVFGVPFLPLPGAAFAITFPWAWYLALPARMVFDVGEPLDMRAMLQEVGEPNFLNPDGGKVKQVAEQVRAGMQVGLDRAVARYGRHPYQLRSLRRSLLRAYRQGKLSRVLPTNWAVQLKRVDRDLHRPPVRNRMHAVLRDWDLAGFYLPAGWPLLSLTRAFRRPPYGYRGMSRERRHALEGRFVWRLKEHPLPPVPFRET